MTTEDIAAPDWEKVPGEISRAIFQQADTYLRATHDLANSIEQRAGMLAGVYTAAAVGALAIVGAFLTGSYCDERMAIAGLSVALVWFIASMCCVAALSPLVYHLPGNEPRCWYGTASDPGPIDALFGCEAENYQARITENLDIAQRRTKRLKMGAWLGASAPLVGFISWVVAAVVLAV